MFKERFGKFIKENYEIHEFGNASSIFKHDYPTEFNELKSSLENFTLKKSNLLEGGGRKSKIPPTFEDPLYKNGWIEKNFDISISLDGVESKIETHKIDCFKNKIGIEVEWNNKTEFYDRDLNNFRVLHSLNALDLGIIITRCDELNDIFRTLDIYSKYGESTTILNKLLSKVRSGSLGGCPLLIFGIKKSLYRDNLWGKKNQLYELKQVIRKLKQEDF